MIGTAATRSARPRPRIGYRQKHASARFRPLVLADLHRDRRFCTSRPVDYDPSVAFASDGSINRYYDPATAQFISVDPLVAETQSPYVYAGDDPVNGVDPLGLSWISSAWDDTGGKVVHAIATHPKVAIGIGLGVLAVATGGLGLAAAAGVEGIAISATTLGVASVVAGGGAAALDYSGCFDTQGDGVSRTLACTGFATGLLGAGFGALAVALPESVFALQLGSVGLGFGIAANGLDIWNAIEGNQSSSSASACGSST
jgi:RHS repeat-associated protein